MFGGVPKDVGGKHKIRGDINCLILGDPGTAKSQFLKYVEKTYHRVVYTTGKGASAVGLTAGVHKDPITSEWVLEGGALVLADKGICLIDEFDKMNDKDRTSIHEAMEQQSISISKAGIVTQLQARCSVIAAANPIKGNYNTSLNFNDNVDLTDPILSRFDILAVVKDEPNEERDDLLATFVLNSHMRSHPSASKDEGVADEIRKNLLDESLALEGEVEGISQDLLKKYIIYARKYVKPQLSDIDKEKVINFYAEIRREANVAGGIPIAVRHIESVLRMSEAFAKMKLNDYVSPYDIDCAIEMLLESFLQSQKHSVARNLSKQFEKYKQKRSNSNQLLAFELSRLVTEKATYERYRLGHDEANQVAIEVRIPLSTLEGKAKQMQVHDLNEFLSSNNFNAKYRVVGHEIIAQVQ